MFSWFDIGFSLGVGVVFALIWIGLGVASAAAGPILTAGAAVAFLLNAQRSK